MVLPTADADAVEGTAWSKTRDLGRHAESVELDSLWVADHLLIRVTGRPDEQLREPWTTLAALAATTNSIGLGTLVSAVPFRSPGLLANTAVTVSEIAAGRLVLGLGCGWHVPELHAFGYPSDHLVSRFEEAVEAIVALTSGERVTRRGRWVRLDDAAVGPSVDRAEAATRRMPLLIGAVGRRMLRLTARWADAWNSNGYGWPDDLFRTRLEAFLRACDDERRDPAGIDVTVGVELAMSSSSRAGAGALRPDSVGDRRRPGCLGLAGCPARPGQHASGLDTCARSRGRSTSAVASRLMGRALGPRSPCHPVVSALI